ncbi:hypothetical protein [Sphingorhabdus contaminans]|uniref:Uncharacterized protein n=1 Tax=Sphingorhabdus contaminans TaxID=1343899 RepID=A0A553WK53_9SPHN|nr:hypothetical protein [Sphingorhabdus contaminans]TSB05100.1 hypothetical protein FOM92_06900 [Sphingorhabdus contaminans]
MTVILKLKSLSPNGRGAGSTKKNDPAQIALRWWMGRADFFVRRKKEKEGKKQVEMHPASHIRLAFLLSLLSSR